MLTFGFCEGCPVLHWPLVAKPQNCKILLDFNVSSGKKNLNPFIDSTAESPN